MSFVHRIISSRPASIARTFLVAATGSTVSRIAENAPLFGRVAKRRRDRIVLQPYKRMHTLQGPLLRLFVVPILILLCLLYGLFFGLTAPYVMVPYFIPIAIIFLLIIWALPAQKTSPTLLLEYLLPLYFIVMILWPNYVAIARPGLPWITLRRLLELPIALLLLINLSVSKRFRDFLLESVLSIKLMWILFCGLMILDIITIGLSASPFASAQLVFNQIIYWFAIFIISAAIFRKVEYIERYFALLCLLGVCMVLLTVYENSHQHIPWASHIPAFLQNSAPSVQNTLTPSFRLYTNIYRAKATFSTPLGLAEYLSLLTPLFLYFGFNSPKFLVKVGSFLMIPVLFMAIRMTDARLGIAGMLISVLLYGSAWSIVRWRSRPRDLFAAAVVYGYPAIFTGCVGAVMASARLHAMVFGGGAQASSSAARDDQLQMALRVLWRAPWGHGVGQSGEAMGFGDTQAITIDNYFITIAMDYGVLGIILWYGIFLTAIFYVFRCCLFSEHTNTREARQLAPLGVIFVAFLVIKWVHGQDDNHPMIFMMLGMVSALIFTLRNRDLAASLAPPATRTSRHDRLNAEGAVSSLRDAPN